VPEAGDREQFGDALDQADNRSLKVCQVGHCGLSTLWVLARALSLRGGLDRRAGHMLRTPGRC